MVATTQQWSYLLSGRDTTSLPYSSQEADHVQIVDPRPSAFINHDLLRLEVDVNNRPAGSFMKGSNPTSDVDGHGDHSDNRLPCYLALEHEQLEVIFEVCHQRCAANSQHTDNIWMPPNLLRQLLTVNIRWMA